MEQCRNCGTTFEGNFCPNCGQRKNQGRIILRQSVKDVLENYFDFDAPLFKTIKDLTIRPGQLIRNYIAGKRKSYSHPLKYYITVLALNLIVSELIGFDPVVAFNDATGLAEMPDPDALSVKAGEYMRVHINFFLLIFVFTLSVFTKLFNRKSGYNFAEYLAMSFYIIAQYVFLSMIPVLLTLVSPTFFLFNFLLVLVYPVWVVIRFHEGGIFKRIVKGIGINLLAWFSYIAIATIVATLIIQTFNL